MNKLERGPIPSKVFNALIRYIFDDPEQVEEDYMDHDECRVVLVAELREEELRDLQSYVRKTAGEDVGALHGIPLSSLEGSWMLVGSRSNSNGLYWDQVTEICKCHEVTETITVTKWKPIDAPDSSKESVPPKPRSKEL